jgi:hypothetical protein
MMLRIFLSGYPELQPLLGALDGVEDGVRRRHAAVAPPGGLAAAARGRCRRRRDQGLDPLQANHDLIHVALGRDVVGVHEELHHGIETDGLAFFSRHRISSSERFGTSETVRADMHGTGACDHF